MIMKITNLSEKESFVNPRGVLAKKVYKTEFADITHLTVASGQSIASHVTPVDVLFYVLEGTGICEIGDEKATVGKDAAIDSPKGVPHAWHNVSDKNLVILVMKLPAPKAV